jgi:hypothetical protein
MKSITYLIKKWWIVAAVFIGIRSKDDLKSVNKHSDKAKHQTAEIMLDEYEINTYHS